MKLRDYKAFATPEEKYRDSLELEDKRRRCSYCDSTEIDFIEYDYGECRDTGYQDQGVRIKCRQCGAHEDG
jgi:RNase P subunit RPR2